VSGKHLSLRRGRAFVAETLERYRTSALVAHALVGAEADRPFWLRSKPFRKGAEPVEQDTEEME